MDDDDIIKALQQVEYEVAKLEAELMDSPPPVAVQTQTATVFQPLSLASLSLQCKSMTLMDAANIGFNFRNLPATWAQNEAVCATVSPPAYSAPLQSISSLQHAAIAPARTVPRSVSSSWKRCLFAAAGITSPLAAMWLHVLSASDASADRATIPVPSALLRFLPLIDPQFADCATRDCEVNVSQGDLQVPSAALHFIPLQTRPWQMISAATLFALSSSASCALLQLPLADPGLNQLLSLAFGDTTGHEHVLWQGEVLGA